MEIKIQLSLKFLLAVFLLLLLGIIASTLYPFNFFPQNRVGWLSDGPGLYFDGNGIAHTDKSKRISITRALSLELLLKERFGSRNWGSKDILSIHDGAGSPPFLLGQWDGRIFLYSRFEKASRIEWYKHFRTNDRFPKGDVHLVTVNFGDEKEIYIDGKLNVREKVEFSQPLPLEFVGDLVVGASPRGKHCWRGEIRGIAVYDRILEREEVIRHFDAIRRKGMVGLSETAGCLALYPLKEGEGNTAISVIEDSGKLVIPSRLNYLATSTFILPHEDMRLGIFNSVDFMKNIILFVFFGILLTAIMLKNFTIGRFALFWFVVFTGGLLSTGIETLQVFLPTRAPGLADIIGNVVGSAMGNVMVLTYQRLVE